MISLCLFVLGAQATRPCCAQMDADALLADLTRPITTGTVDANTRWAFRAKSPVTVSSRIIRLRDVAVPIDPQMSGWQRLSHSPIGLVPLSGKPMMIDRNLLSHAIRRAEATPAAIDWLGPETIKVVYQPKDKYDPAIRQAAYANPGDTVDGNQIQPPPSLSGAAAKSVVKWIQTAIDRQFEEISESFDLEIDARQPALVPLRSMVNVPVVTFVDEVTSGICRVRVVGRSVNGPCESVVSVTLEAHPVVVFSRKSVYRGDRIRAEHLVQRPLPRSEMEPAYVTDPAELIGMEVYGSVRADRPIPRDAVGPPILIKRGDLVDIRVIGGGISVTTKAKAMEDGAQSNTIEVETLNPRKRLLARVVNMGMVEIVTRAPRVSQ